MLGQLLTNGVKSNGTSTLNWALAAGLKFWERVIQGADEKIRLDLYLLAKPRSIDEQQAALDKFIDQTMKKIASGGSTGEMS